MSLHSSKLSSLFIGIAFVLTASANAMQQDVKNLNRKIRVTPSQIASRIGTGVNWESNWNAAVARCRDTGNCHGLVELERSA